jgi:DNA polymerase-4
VLLLSFCEEVGFDLRHRGLRGRTVTLKARYSDFKTVTRTQTLDFATNLGPRLYVVAKELLGRVQPGPLRLIGIQVSRLEDVRTQIQGSLFDEGPGSRQQWLASVDRIEKATASADAVREKYGRGMLVPASLLGQKRHRSHGPMGRADGAPEPNAEEGEASADPEWPSD